MKQYLTEAEAAKMLGKKKQTLANDRNVGRGPVYIKAGGSVRYDIDDIIRYMEENKIDPGKNINRKQEK